MSSAGLNLNATDWTQTLRSGWDGQLWLYGCGPVMCVSFHMQTLQRSMLCFEASLGSGAMVHDLHHWL